MVTTTRNLILTPVRAIPAGTVASCLNAYGLDLACTSVVTHARLGDDGTIGEPSASVDTLVSLADLPTWHSPRVLEALQKALKPGGKLVMGSLVAQRDLTKELLVAGFTDAEASESAVGVAGAVVARKPTWEAGASFSLKSRKPKAAQNNGASNGAADKRCANAANCSSAANCSGPGNCTTNGDGSANSNGHTHANAWKLIAEGNDDLMDEDDLLTEDDIKRPAPVSDCEIGPGRKACKNCSCGRADMDEEELAAAGEDFVSACGNCYLGDAFRCASCPYLGKPAFKEVPGEKVTLDLTSDL